MNTHVFTAVIKQCKVTGQYADYVPGFTGTHYQGKTLDELNKTYRKSLSCCWKMEN